MAVLSDADRLECAAEYMRETSARRELIAINKADLRAAVNALDQFLHDNAAAINSAIPQPARSQLTQAQKAEMLVFVIRKRYLTGS